MEKVGILVVSYGAREAAMIDAFDRSRNYRVQLYIVDKQRNPFNMKKAVKHVVIPDLSIERICAFALANREEVDFALVGPEKPIIEGVRDLVEQRTGIPVICPTQDCAIENSKIQQRLLFQEIAPKANPRFRIFNPNDYKSTGEARRAVYRWLDELDDMAVVKPDKPAAGKGVGVWGDHFNTREQLFDHFASNFQHGTVIVEEKVDGEESSFQAFCDGQHLVPLPSVRDYKRAFDDDKGPNTGGMGSYKDVGDKLPFMNAEERKRELSVATKIFEEWRKKINDASALRGVPLYLAFIHTGSGLKILENNSRPGDPEIMNILPLLKEDFVDICFKMLNGNLTRIELEEAATVLTYKVPPNYGGFEGAFPDRLDAASVGTPVDLSRAYALSGKYRDKIRVYPAAMERRNGNTYALKSRSVGLLGIGKDIEEARRISLEVAEAVSGGALWNRTDIASERHIAKSVSHMERLRRKR